jgi:hypothetical protein
VLKMGKDMKISMKSTLLFVLSLSSFCANAERTGNEWLRFEQSSEVVDQIASLEMLKSAPLNYCKLLGYSFTVPHGVVPGQQSKILTKYLDNHPEELHQELNYLICKAYNTAWGK